MNTLLAVAAGGAIGASARYLFSAQALRWLGPDFPWGTLGVNIIGSLIMGLLIEVLALKVSASAELRSFLTTGILGGFTTFSAFSLDVANLIERKDGLLAAFYAVGSVGGAVLALFIGLWIARWVLA